MSAHINLAAHAEGIARAILGEPNKARSTREQLRFGSNGSIAVEIGGEKVGTFFDHENEIGGGMLDLVRRKLGNVTKAEAVAWLQDEKLIPPAGPKSNGAASPSRKVVNYYVYRDEAGEPLFRVTRWQPKTFTQARWDAAAGKFVSGKGCMKGVRRVPYRLPELLAAEGRVFIVEGEKDGDRLASLGLVATTNPGGGAKKGKGQARVTKKWPPEFAPFFAGRDVVVIPDADAAGRAHAGTIARSLLAAAASVRILELPGLPEKGDVSDWLDQGHEIAELILLADAAEPLNPAAAEPETTAADDERPAIKIVETKFNEAARRAAAGMRDVVYMRGFLPRVLARVASVGGRRIEDKDGDAVMISGIRHQLDSSLLIEASTEIVASHLDDRFTFWKWSQRHKAWVGIACPTRISGRIIGAATRMGFRPCSGFARVPLLFEGEIVTTSGYHEPTGLIVEWDGSMRQIPISPTKRDAVAALDVLLHPFRGYLKDAPESKPALGAAALTSALRASLKNAPALLIDGNLVGAGKGKMGRALGIIACGTIPAVVTEGHNEEEFEKRIAAAILQGPDALLFDNMQRTIASSGLESILTEGIAEIRIFGRLDSLKTECRTLIIITSNNATLRRDMLRRTLPVRIRVPTDKPELREFDFDPVAEARRLRPQLLAAAFTITKAWLLARDRPENREIRSHTLGSFEEWAALVAGAVEWVTGTSPISMIEANKDSDPRVRAEAALIAALYRQFPTTPFLATAAAREIDAELWREIVRFKGDKPDGSTIGYWFRRRKDQPFTIDETPGKPRTRVTLTRAGENRAGLVEWQITPVQNAGDAGDCRGCPAPEEKSGRVERIETLIEGGVLPSRRRGGENPLQSPTSPAVCALCSAPIIRHQDTLAYDGRRAHAACVELREQDEPEPVDHWEDG
jgi:hypothetical protein